MTEHTITVDMRIVACINAAGWCVRPGLNTAYVVGRQGASDAEFKGCSSLAEAAQIVADATKPPPAVTIPAARHPRLSVVLGLTTTQPDAETRQTLAAALCQVAIHVATGMRAGIVDDEDGTIVARFRIEEGGVNA